MRRGLAWGRVRSRDRRTDRSRRRRGAPSRELSGRPGDGPGSARQAHLEPVPGAHEGGRRGPRHLRADGRHRGRPRGAHGRRRRHVHLRGPRRRDAALRAGAARGAAAEDHHPRRRGHRPRHRVDVVPQRAAARVGAGDGHPHRRGRGGHRVAAASTPTCSAPSPTRTGRWATPCGCASNSSPSSRSSRSRTCGSTRSPIWSRRWTASSQTGRLDGVPVDYLDGVVFSADESYLCVGDADRGIRPRQRLHRSADLLPLDPARRRREDATGSPSTTICGAGTPTGSGAPRRSGRSIRSSVDSGRGAHLRSSSYWKLMRLERRFDIGDRLEKLHGRPPRERVIQDVEVPIERCAEFLDWFLANVPIEPIWLCPLRLRDDERLAAVPAPAAAETYVNVGFWSTVPVGATEGETNRRIERRVSELDGHKSLYSDAFYSHGRVRRAVRRRDLPRREAAVRPRLHDSSTSMRRRCNDDDHVQGEAGGCRGDGPDEPTDAGAPGRRGAKAHPRRGPRDLRRRPAAAEVHRVRRELGRSRRRAVRPRAEDPARHDLPRHRLRRSRAGPRLHRRRPRHPRRASRRSVRAAQGARREPRVRATRRRG